MVGLGILYELIGFILDCRTRLEDNLDLTLLVNKLEIIKFRLFELVLLLAH